MATSRKWSNEETQMRYGYLITATALCLSNTALAQTTVSFHVKAPDQSCSQVLFEYKDTKKPGAKQVKETIANPKGKKGEFSPLLTVNVESGHHHIAQITCLGKTASKNYSLVHVWNKRLLSGALPGFQIDELHYDVSQNETLYIGAFERVNMGKYRARKTGASLDLRAPIMTDQSQLAVTKGELSPGLFRTSLIGASFDTGHAAKSQETIDALGDLNDLLIDGNNTNPIPKDGGKGELALHYFNNTSCPNPKGRLVKIDANGDKGKSETFKFKKAKTGQKNPLYTKSLSSGRYHLTGLNCDNRLYAPQSIYAEFDIHDEETTYGGELFMDVKLDLSAGQVRQSFKLATRDQYEVADIKAESKYNMVKRNGLTPTVLKAQADGGINRASAKTGAKASQYKIYKDVQDKYGDKLVLPKPKTP